MVSSTSMCSVPLRSTTLPEPKKDDD